MKILKVAGILLSTLIVYSVVNQYLFCTRYRFEAGGGFQGPNIFNPYQQTDAINWSKSNFHAHGQTWAGLTNGKGTSSQIHEAYENLGYTFHSVSNYHQIDESLEHNPHYISSYEHGFNILKAHHQVIGASEVEWLDFVFPQTPHNKQHLIEKLSRNPDHVLVINHPAIRHAFREEDLGRLSGYQFMETLNPAAHSLTEWDAALSAGLPIFGMANDDIHNVFDTPSVGRYCTWVYTPEIDQATLIKSLQNGKTYAMLIGYQEEEPEEARTERIRNRLPRLAGVHTFGDSLVVRFTVPADKIRWVGQGGVVIDSAFQTATDNYRLKARDTYTRIEATFADGSVIYLNPLFRYHDHPLLQRSARIDYPVTFLYRTVGTLLLIMWAWLFILPNISFAKNFFPPFPPLPGIPTRSSRRLRKRPI